MKEAGFDLAGFGRALAGMLQQQGSAGALAELGTLLQLLVPVDDLLVLVYRRQQSPETLLDISRGPDRERNLGLYLQGAYLLDPFYQAWTDGRTDGCFRIGALAPTAFRSSEYYRVHHALTGIRDEIGYLFTVPTGECLHVSLGVRGDRARYTAREEQRLRDIEPLLAELMQRYWAALARTEVPTLNNQLESALQFFGCDFLTERETEVIQLLLRGHSTKSIAERLGISPETVKLHRKHSYAKLDVSSQAELFHLFIDALGQVGCYRGGDPLTGYLTH